ncbi:MAG: zinc-binding dehydrogenase, partial [Janthinobacterium sp.]
LPYARLYVATRAVLGTVRGDGLEKALRIVKPGSRVVSLVGPPDAAFARARGMHFMLTLVFGLLSRKIIGLARRRGASYAFHFVRPDGGQLAQIGALLEAGSIRPVIDRVFPFLEAKQALAYLAQGRARGKVVVQLPQP